MASPGSALQVRMRSPTSCDSCREARRKCDANPVACAWCLTHDIPCIYSPRKRRGPTASLSLDTSLAKAHPLNLHHEIVESVPRPVSHVDDFATPQLPTVLSTPDDLRRAIRFANRAFLHKLVDEESFLTALGEPAHQAPYGLRSCAFALLSLTCRLVGGDVALADSYVQRALRCLDRSMCEQPNRHLVSALLLVAVMPPPNGHCGGSCDDISASVYAALATHFSDLSPDLCSEVRLAAAVIGVMAKSSPSSILWPASTKPIGALSLPGAAKTFDNPVNAFHLQASWLLTEPKTSHRSSRSAICANFATFNQAIS